MAKRAVRAKKRTVRRTAKKQSFFERFFTFPRLAVFFFAALLIIFVHQISLPGNDVKAASTVNDVSIAKKITIRIWKDKNGNGKQDSGEGCFSNKVTFTVNGVSFTQTSGSNCLVIQAIWIKGSKECNTVKFTGLDNSNYVFSRIQYLDNTTSGNYKYTNSKSKSVCGYPEVTQFEQGGFKYNELNFGIKPK